MSPPPGCRRQQPGGLTGQLGCRETAKGVDAGQAGLKIQLHPNGTAIEACNQAVHAMGCPRVYTTVKINTRTDKDQTLENKVASVQALL
jgi:uncharacterized protein YqgV (UPF0045/DUF77 family)